MKKKLEPQPTSTALIRQTNPQGVLTGMFNQGIARSVPGAFYEALRRGIPLIDAAIIKLIFFNGIPRIIGDNMALVRELEDIAMHLPVNDMQRGLLAYTQNIQNEVLEQGFVISELVATKDLADIAGVRVADSKQIIFRLNDQGVVEPWYRYPGIPGGTPRFTPVERILNVRYGQNVNISGLDEVRMNPANIFYMSQHNENSDPYGASMMLSLEFVADLMVTIQVSLKNVFQRHGDPMFHVNYKPGKGVSGTELTRRQNELKENFNAVVNAKRRGRSGDLVTAGPPDSEVSISVIGAEGQVIDSKVALSHVIEQIVSKSGLAGWILGISSQTVQGMASLEVESALADAKVRQEMMMPGMIRLLSQGLSLRGRKWNRVTTSLDKPGDWGVIFESPNIRDIESVARAAFLTAQAEQMRSQANQRSSTAIQVIPTPPKSACACGSIHTDKSVHGDKETRPQPWPELDDIEQGYEDQLIKDWSELSVHALTLLGLGGLNDKGTKDALDGLPMLDKFTYTEEQEAMIRSALDRFVTKYDPSDPASPVNLFYGMSVGAGVLKAAKISNLQRPVIELIQNSQFFEKLVSDGFDLLKNDATKSILEQIIPEMHAHMLAGSNPLSVAARLKRIFGDEMNADWRRLARTEMTLAAERAKIKEWKAEGVKTLRFITAPDACPKCAALAGDYPVDKCPLPCADTHPS